MPKLLSKVSLGFAFLLFNSTIYASYIPSRETVRYIFLFHDQLAIQPQLSSSLSSRISTNINNEYCISSPTIQKLSSKYKNPRDIVTAISEHINNTCINLEITDKKINPTLDLEKYSLYILFSSEWSSNVESSFGHIRLAFMTNDNYMFNPTYTFSAYNFYSSDSSGSIFKKYLNAAFSNVEGKFSTGFFFDNYYETVIKESRKIHRFKVNMNDSNLQKINKTLQSLINEKSDYNFFLKNCSSESLNLIAKYSNSIEIKGISPSEQLRYLLNKNLISYTDTFKPITKDRKYITPNKNDLDTIIYDKLSTLSLGKNSLGISLYKSPRSIDNSTHNFGTTELLKLESNLINNTHKVVLIDKQSTAKISSGRPSLRLKLGYNTDNYLYAGIGNIHNNIAYDSLLGYSNILGFSSFSSIKLRYQLVDLTLGFQANRDDSITSIDFDFYLTDRLSILVNSNNKYNNMKLNYTF